MSPQRRALSIAATGLVVLGYAVWSIAMRATPAPAASDGPDLALPDLPSARVRVHARRGDLVIELPPVDLASHAGHDNGHHALDVPVAIAELPISGTAVGFRIELVDASGRALSQQLVHHLNVMDPTRRELFLPIGQRVAAAGKETGTVRFPRLLVGKRFRAGDRLVASAVLHNPGPESYRGVHVRMVVSYVPAGRPWPLLGAAPWQLDVAFPVGDKSFDLPPGRSERSYDASPVVPGRIAIIGGHLHDYGERLELWNVTTGELLWSATPVRDSAGRVLAMPVGKLYGLTRLGMRITPQHRYRVRVVYDNPTGRVVRAGGMGVVGGLFIPDGDVAWPAPDPTDSLYQQDLRHFTRLGPAPTSRPLPGRAHQPGPSHPPATEHAGH